MSADSSSPECLVRGRWSWEQCGALCLNECQSLVVHYSTKRVLLAEEDGRFVLPGFVGNPDDYPSSYVSESVTSKIRQIVGEGLELYVLRQIWMEERDFKFEGVNYSLEKAVVLMECENNPVPETYQFKNNVYRWVPVENARICHLFVGAKQAIRRELQRISDGYVPANRLIWQQPGWIKKTMKWVADVLRDHRSAVITNGPFVERSTPYGTIVYVVTTKGRFFLKCTASTANDASYTLALSKILPKFVAAPVAVDAARQLIITQDYGEILRPSSFNTRDLVNLTRDYATLQKRAAERVEELISAGMQDYRPSNLLRRFKWLLDQPVLDDLSRLSEFKDTVELCRKHYEIIADDFNELDASKMPVTVTHNDFSFSNVYKTDESENYMFFDWVDGHVGHPFTTNWSDVDIDAYVEMWSEYGTFEELKTLLRTGQTVRAVIESFKLLTEAVTLESPEADRSFEALGTKLTSIAFEMRSRMGSGGDCC